MITKEACSCKQISNSQVARWINEVENGSEGVEKHPIAGRSINATDKLFIRNSDRRLTSGKSAQKLEISVRSLHTVIRN